VWRQNSHPAGDVEAIKVLARVQHKKLYRPPLPAIPSRDIVFAMV
jgi:hypothetical protein